MSKAKQIKINAKDADTKKLDKALKDIESALSGPWSEAAKAWRNARGQKTTEKAPLFQRLVKITEAIHGDNH
jgi:hypothetical protein